MIIKIHEKKFNVCVLCNYNDCSNVSFSKILYTGDFSRQEDRHLMAAEIPNIKPDILIIVSFPPPFIII